MTIERPDLSRVDPQVRAYIEVLETELEELRSKRSRSSATMDRPEIPLEPDEPPTTFNVVTISRSGLIKRTPRHLYGRQRRGGMGIFDLESPDNDPPAILTIADQDDTLLIITSRARVFRLSLKSLAESPVRSRGKALTEWLPLQPHEKPAIVLPYQANGYIVLVTHRGHVRRFRFHLFKETMHSGMLLFDPAEIGVPAAACWSAGEGELFIATKEGRAIRFAENLVPARGCLGIRLTEGDTVVAVTPVVEESGVFLLSADGKGIIREMTGFSPNKAPGSGGKNALKTDLLTGALNVDHIDDIFVISRLGKIIRFQAAEVSTTGGVVQGVNCISLRGDEAVALAGNNSG